MPLIYALLYGLVQAAGSIAGSVLISLGIGYVAYSGLDTSLVWLRTQVAGSFTGFGAQGLAVLSALQVGSGLSVLLSALAARLVIDGLTSGVMKRMVVK